jgi:Mn2+/Fe2+ NRAMP family transporter
VAASVYYPSKSNGYRVPPNLGEIGFLEAGSLLQSALGRKIAPVLFGVALLASGQSSTVTGTYAGQFVMEGFIDIKITAWLRNILTRCLTVIPSLTICLLNGKDGANRLIIASSVVLSFQLPFALIPLLKFTSSEKIMNVHKNSKAMKITCVVLAGIVLFANFAMIYSSVIVSLKASLLSGLATVVYFGCILYIACRPVSLGPAGSYSALNEATEILTESFGSSADSSSGT